jgi:hypothetical protein
MENNNAFSWLMVILFFAPFLYWLGEIIGLNTYIELQIKLRKLRKFMIASKNRK